MTSENGRNSEIGELLEALCEDRITRAQAARLEELVLNDREARRFYLDYIHLHGTLHWDAALLAEETPTTAAPETTPGSPPHTDSSRGKRLRYSAGATALLAACALGLALLWGWRIFSPAPPEDGPAEPRVAEKTTPEFPPTAGTADLEDQRPPQPTSNEPVRLRSVETALETSSEPGTPAVAKQPATGPVTSGAVAVTARPPDAERAAAEPVPGNGRPSSSSGIVAFINRRIRARWQQEEIEPSPVAADSEWIRRVYLDLVGHIPPPGAVEDFLRDDDPHKHAKLVDRLLDHPDYVRNWTTVWTRLLIGRTSPETVDRAALRKFLRTSFARNRPWNEIVHDLIAAEGSSERNGAANFLVAHLNNEAVPATAITARLFLGVQVQCTQCHSHPFNDWTQDQFWSLNSFFQQTEVVQRRRSRNGKTLQETALVSGESVGPVYYETRRGLMRVAYPEFGGKQIDPDSRVNLRRELAQLMTHGEKPLVARSLVNRMWAHFFGHGFTRPVDDMGPHNPPTHPELLDRLTREFVRSGYDLKQLVRWICRSRPYRLTSRFSESNRADEPQAGYAPLFSRMYVKPMTAEQLYDSLLVATRADRADPSSWESADENRQKWVQQFVFTFQTEENDETDTFDGSVTQALTLMNGALTDRALSAKRGTYLHEVLASDGAESDKIRRLCLAALARHPTQNELAAFRKLLRERLAAARGRPNRNPRAALARGLQDVFWAYLNSNEFITNH